MNRNRLGGGGVNAGKWPGSKESMEVLRQNYKMSEQVPKSRKQGESSKRV